MQTFLLTYRPAEVLCRTKSPGKALTQDPPSGYWPFPHATSSPLAICTPYIIVPVYQHRL